VQVLAKLGYPAELPAGAFYLWVPAPGGDAWRAARELAKRAGLVVSPGEFYGPHGQAYFRVAAVQPDDRIELAAARVGA
jgi:aspartate/methionine/tyrosine aminotransferase